MTPTKRRIKVLAFMDWPCLVGSPETTILQKIRQKHQVVAFDVRVDILERVLYGVDTAPQFIVVVDQNEIYRTNDIRKLL